MSARHRILSAEQCRVARLWLGLSQGDLARMAGVGERSVGRFESGGPASADARLLLRGVMEKSGLVTFESDGGLRLRPADEGGGDA